MLELDQHGFLVSNDALDTAALDGLRAEAERLAEAHPDSAHGLRNLLEHSPRIRDWVESGACHDLVPAGYSAVRAILFDKLPGANWKVAWHQDLTIALCKEVAMPGYGPWSRKYGVPHVQPPVALLEEMITVRLHLDRADEGNGALRVIPGSHRHGRLDPEAIRQWRAGTEEHVCICEAGDALLMRPLLLHASAPAAAPRHRRVVHIEFAQAESLPPPLSWAELVRPRD